MIADKAGGIIVEFTMGKHQNLGYNPNQWPLKNGRRPESSKPVVSFKDAKNVQSSMPETLHSKNLPESAPAQASSPDSRLERQREVALSYECALGDQQRPGRVHFAWATCIITLGTCGIWCVTAYQVALTAHAHTLRAIVANVLANSEDARVLLAFGAKYNPAIQDGQYWRLVTATFLHANILHVSLNMLNLLLFGLFSERIFGHTRFVLIYLLTGICGNLASFVFAPTEISIGASGAIFGLVGAYCIFILVHRLAFRHQGITALGWLILVVGINLGLGFVTPNVDNYAHIGGLLSGCLLGWCFTPFYKINPAVNTLNGSVMLTDIHSLTRRWPLALLLIVLTLLSAIITIHFVGG